MKAIIESVYARRILDSRGEPTVEAQVTLVSGESGIGQAPSGASTGKNEAVQLRDKTEAYNGKDVLSAVKNINEKIAPILKGKNADDIGLIDSLMTALDGTEELSVLGANAVLAVSIACAEASARAAKMPLYRYLGGISARRLPTPMMNIINGGAHSSAPLDVQEFMIVPSEEISFSAKLKECSEIYQTLKSILKKRGLSTAVGDEGGFSPDISTDTEAIELILEAAETAGYKPGKDVFLALDAAAGEWAGENSDEYYLKKSGRSFTAQTLADHWKMLVSAYPIISVEDPFSEDDIKGWQGITRELGEKIRIVGDDLFVTNSQRVKNGAELKIANAVLIKPNQTGTLSRAIECVRTAKAYGLTPIVSHRSGETESSFIADLAAALNVRYIKTGAPCRGERISKYNRLLRIEDELFKHC